MPPGSGRIPKAMKLLIVEDHEILAGLIKRLAGSLVSSCEITDRLGEAIKLICTERFDVIWLDLFLLDASADDTIKAIPLMRATAPEAIIVVLTGAVDAKECPRAVAAGADACLHKTQGMSAQMIFELLATGALKAQERGVTSAAQFLERVTQTTADLYK